VLIPGWHPLVVHFPFALCITGTLALAASRLARGDRLAATLATVGTWNLFAGAVAALAAIGTGLAALIDLHVGLAAHQAILVHVKWAILTSTTLLLLAVWRGAGNAHDARPSWALLTMLLLASAAMAVTGYRGDVNVYRFGIGVSRNASESTRMPASLPASPSPPAAPAG